MEKFIQVIETERLIGKRISTDDLDDLIKMNSDIKIIKVLGGKKQDYKETIEYTKKRHSHWNENNFGIWIFRDKETKRFIGKGGFEFIENSNKEVFLDLIVSPKYWNQGFGSEIGKTCLDIAFNKLHLEELSCFVLSGNLAAQRLMEKLGFKYTRDIITNETTYIVYTLVHEMA
jgi:ribosomal-protein-alanine N-acetyltransferase